MDTRQIGVNSWVGVGDSGLYLEIVGGSTMYLVGVWGVWECCRTLRTSNSLSLLESVTQMMAIF